MIIVIQGDKRLTNVEHIDHFKKWKSLNQTKAKKKFINGENKRPEKTNHLVYMAYFWCYYKITDVTKSYNRNKV